MNDVTNIIIKLPEEVEFIIDKLESAGYEAYIVGGCVRDSLLNIKPNDWDITTAARPEEVMSLFKQYKILPTGLKHGTVTIVMPNGSYEVTTFRIEGDYTDARHPDKVEFVSTLKEDLARRDFTINAMAYNPKRGLIDPFNGTEYMVDKVIMTVGLPYFRFHEDALRVFRAIRFSAKFDYAISDAILHEIDNDEELTDLLLMISKERICSELQKILALRNGGKQYLSDIYLFGRLLGRLIPDVREYVSYEWLDRFNNFVLKPGYNTYPIMETIMRTSRNPYLRYTLFFDSPKFESIMRELRFDNDSIRHVKNIRSIGCELIENYNGRKRKHKARRILKEVDDKYDAINAVLYARVHSPESQHSMYDYLYDSVINITLNDNECYKIKHLKVNGDDAISLGFVGKDCGDILNKLLDMVITEEIENDRDVLLKEMERMKNEI